MQYEAMKRRVAAVNREARGFISDGVRPGEWLNGVRVVPGHDHPGWCFANPCTYGQYIFRNGRPWLPPLQAHEYIHVLQWEGRGTSFGYPYIAWAALRGSGPSNPEEATGYLWEAWTAHFGEWEAEPWQVWKRPARGGPRPTPLSDR